MSTRSVRQRASARRSAGNSQASLNWPFVRTGSAIAAILLGFVGGLSLLFPEGRITEPIEHWLRLGFGWSAPLVPLWLAIGGVLLLTWSAAPSTSRPWRRLAGLSIFSLAAGPFLHLLPLGPASPLARAEAGLGGGWAGYLASGVLVEALGEPATMVVLLALLSVGLLLLFRVSAAQAWAAVQASGRAGLWLASRARRREPSSELRVNPSDAQPRTASLARRLARLFTRRRLAVAPAVLPGPAPSGRRGWELPPLSLFRPGTTTELSQPDLRMRARVIEETLASFNIEARVVEANPGPTVTQFGLEPAPGVAVNRILARSNDLALRLGASPVRLEAPVPGKRVVGLEVPNSAVSTVNIRELLESEECQRIKSRLRLALGRDVSGRPVIGDLARMPHLLIAGATGSGKSVCINSIIASLLVQSTPDDLQFLMVDPKMVELVGYGGIPHLRMPVVTEMDRVVGALKWAVREMERRYNLFSKHAARNLEAWNRMAAEESGQPALPFLVVVIDELADMMMTAADEVERTLCRLAQLGRAAGIHLVVATQRPSVDVLTGLIKANFVTRIAFAVSSQVDSRVILDMAGAEKLLGRGDMLYVPPDSSKPIRLQGAYVSDQEIQDLVSYWRRLGGPRYSEEEVDALAALGREDESEDDELYERAEELAQQYSRLSVSLLQRRLGIGYPRAARLVDLLEERGVVAPSVDGKSREVLVREPAEVD